MALQDRPALLRALQTVPVSGVAPASARRFVDQMSSEFDAANAYTDSQVASAKSILLLTPQASFPSSPAEGSIVAKTDHHIYYWNGSAWKQLDN